MDAKDKSPSSAVQSFLSLCVATASRPSLYLRQDVIFILTCRVANSLRRDGQHLGRSVSRRLRHAVYGIAVVHQGLGAHWDAPPLRKRASSYRRTGSSSALPVRTATSSAMPTREAARRGARARSVQARCDRAIAHVAAEYCGRRLLRSATQQLQLSAALLQLPF